MRVRGGNRGLAHLKCVSHKPVGTRAMASSSPQSQQLRALLLSSSPEAITQVSQSIQSLLRRHSPELTREFFRLSFPLLLQKLFGFQDCHSHTLSASLFAQSGGWLSQFSSPFSESPVHALISLFSPSGVLFSLLLDVDKESSVRFVFPTERLPNWVQRLLSLQNGAFILSHVSKLFKDRIKIDASGGLQVQLDVFEYFIFWFAYYAICKDSSSHQVSFSSKRDRLSLKTVQKRSLQNWVSGLHQQFHNGISDYPPDPYLHLLQLYLDRFVTDSYPTRVCGTSKYALSPTDSSRSEFLVHTLIEFWLIDDDPLPFSLGVRRSVGLSMLISAGHTYVTPGSELTYSLRVFVGHMNKLCTLSVPEPPMSWTVANSSATEATFTYPGFHALGFRTGSSCLHNTYAHTLRRPLYRFIARAFSFWPAGSSVRKATFIVDLWLDYLQPWDSPSSGIMEQQVSVVRAATEAMQSLNNCLYSERWQSYVMANYLFFSSLVVHFLEFALKFLHLDPEIVLQMTSKVLNVLAGSSDLLNWLREIDTMYGKVWFDGSQHSNDIISGIQEQLWDWEESENAEYNQASGTLHPLQWELRASQLQFFSVGENGGQHILSMLILQAEAEIQTVSQARLAPCTQALEAIKKAGRIIFCSPTYSSLDAARPFTETKQTPQPVMVWRAFPQHTWSDVKYKGDWMRRPIESTEMAWLVRYLVRLSDIINEKLDLKPICETPQRSCQPEEKAKATLSADFTGTHLTQDLRSPRDISLNHTLINLPGLMLKLLRSYWLILHHQICSRGLRVNLRILAKKPIAFAICLLVSYFWTSLIIFHLSYNSCNSPG